VKTIKTIQFINIVQALPRPLCHSMSLVDASMGSNSTRSHFCWHTSRLIYAYVVSSSIFNS